mgnify:CR=1 FL=1
MANGYQKGEYFTQFLNQLPQLVQMQQNMRLQEERLDLQRETAGKDAEYRTQYLQQLKDNKDSSEMNALLDDTEDLRHKAIIYDRYDMHELATQVREDYETLQTNKSSLRNVYSSNEDDALGSAIPNYLKTADPNSGGYQDVVKYRDKIIDDRATTYAEVKADAEFGSEYTFLEKQLTRMDVDHAAIIDSMNAVVEKYNEAKLGRDKGKFGNQDIDTQADDLLNGAFLGRGVGDDDIDITNGDEEPEASTTTKGKPITTTPIAEDFFIADEEGLEGIVETYAPKGKLGILEKSAREGSVIKPVSNEVFKAIEGGLGVLDKSAYSLYTLTLPAVLASKPKDFDQRYQKSSSAFKNTLKDMYNLYLRLDPAKGAYQTTSTTGNIKMRDKIKAELQRYKKIGAKSKSAYRFDEEIQQILDSIRV